jgi:2-keto-4-pentenoate hydratase
MLFSSRSRAYAYALKEAQASRKAVAPQAHKLGLTPESSCQTLEDLHTFYVAEGVASVGRKIITGSPHAKAENLDHACLGYLYRVEFAGEDGELPAVRTHGSTRFRLEPKLMLRFAEVPQIDAGLDAFIAAIDAIALSVELQLVPFADASWRFEDEVCANGFSKTLISGEMKTLSRSSKQNFSQLLDLSNFSVSRTTATGSTLVDYMSGRQTSMSSIVELHELIQRQQRAGLAPAVAQGDFVALNAVSRPQSVTAGDEWVCVSTGFELDSLRIRFVK